MRAAALAIVALMLPVAAAQDQAASHDPRNLTWIDDGVLAVGGGGLNESDVDWLYGAGFRAIADLRAEHHDPAAYIEGLGMSYLRIPIDSATDINETQLASFVAWARDEHAQGRPVYVHCANGWHRGATFAVAWAMAADGASYDRASSDLIARRPGVVMRGMGALLDMGATLAGAPPLAVTLESPRTRAGPNATMVARVHVEADGAPAEGARVEVWSEGSKISISGVTDANGDLAFTYADPTPALGVDQVHARASLPGHADGGDVIEIPLGEASASRGALHVTAARVDDKIIARATLDGAPVPVRFVMRAPGVSAIEASADGVASFAAPSGDITIRAVAWGAEADAISVAPPPPTPPSPPPSRPLDGSAAIGRAIPSDGAMLAILAAAIALYTDRPGSRRR